MVSGSSLVGRKFSVIGGVCVFLVFYGGSGEGVFESSIWGFINYVFYS